MKKKERWACFCINWIHRIIIRDEALQLLRTVEVCFLLQRLNLLFFIFSKQWGQFYCGGGNYCGARGFLIGWKHSELHDQLTAADQSGSTALMSPVVRPPPAERLMVANPLHTERRQTPTYSLKMSGPEKQPLQVNRGQNNLVPPADNSHHALQVLLYGLQARVWCWVNDLFCFLLQIEGGNVV